MVAGKGVSVQNVFKSFQSAEGERVCALGGVDLEIRQGEFVSLIGASGCGKSTLLRLIAGLDFPDAGRVLVDGEEVRGPSSERGFAFQAHTLFPWLNVRQNVAFGLRAKERRADADKWIQMVGLAGFEKAYPHELSGGMQQRASLARALVAEPRVLLLDEPLGALDAFTRMNMQDEILKLWSESGATMILVTHDADEAVYLSDRVVILTPRPGKIEASLDIELARPRARSGDDFAYYRGKILDLLHFGGERQETDYYL